MPAVSIDPPLTLWYCDECRQPITDVYSGTVCWEDPSEINSDSGRLEYDFPAKYVIVHKVRCDDLRERTSSHDLNYMVGPLGMQWWAYFLWRGPMSEPMQFVQGINPKPVMDLFYRLFIPYYEQARQHFNSQYAREVLDGGTIYSESELKGIIESSGN